MKFISLTACLFILSSLLHAQALYQAGSACIGVDCITTPSFPLNETVSLKENNLRIRFNNTLVSNAVFGKSWQIEANSANNGGDSYLAIMLKGLNKDTQVLSNGSYFKPVPEGPLLLGSQLTTDEKFAYGEPVIQAVIVPGPFFQAQYQVCDISDTLISDGTAVKPRCNQPVNHSDYPQDLTDGLIPNGDPLVTVTGRANGFFQIVEHQSLLGYQQDKQLQIFSLASNSKQGIAIGSNSYLGLLDTEDHISLGNTSLLRSVKHVAQAFNNSDIINLQDVNSLSNSLQKLDKIEQAVAKIELRLTALEALKKIKLSILEPSTAMPPSVTDFHNAGLSLTNAQNLPLITDAVQQFNIDQSTPLSALESKVVALDNVLLETQRKQLSPPSGSGSIGFLWIMLLSGLLCLRRKHAFN